MLGIREDGLVIMAWAIGVLLFQDWVIHLDAAVRRIVSGQTYRPADEETERRRLLVTARILLVVGGVAFVVGAFIKLDG
jgi:hypothetical protein